MSASKASTVYYTKGAAPIQPSETANSYFPEGATESTLATPAASTAHTPSSSNSPSVNNPLSPLDREYTEPLQDLNIAEQLSKQPPYWSVKGWVQRSANSDVIPAREDPETRTQKFEAAKRDLLASVGRF
ncbi:hypothetical protein F5Y09DRAFT_254517 [Xylaria sp. FL1042]|nr:hypothetical protein F5Y09DRAFT_254517 [Xylaria sp. FL1042]